MYKGSWRTICADSWSMEDANVLCRSLGYSNALSADIASSYGAGNYNIILGMVSCYGNETFIQDCPHTEGSSCSIGQVAGVKCNGTNSKLRLTGGDTMSGVVEVFHEGVWGTICSGLYGYMDAKVRIG